MTTRSWRRQEPTCTRPLPTSRERRCCSTAETRSAVTYRNVSRLIKSALRSSTRSSTIMCHRPCRASSHSTCKTWSCRWTNNRTTTRSNRKLKNSCRASYRTHRCLSRARSLLKNAIRIIQCRGISLILTWA